MKRLFNAAALIVLLISIAAGAFAQQSEKPAEKKSFPPANSSDLKKKEVNRKDLISIDKEGKIRVDPKILQSNDLLSLLIKIRIDEGRTSNDKDGKIVITPRYPMDCQIYFQILNLPKMPTNDF